MFVPLAVSDLIAALQLVPEELFLVCRKQNGKYGRTIVEWAVCPLERNVQKKAVDQASSRAGWPRQVSWGRARKLGHSRRGASTQLSVSARTVDYWISKGRLKAIKLEKSVVIPGTRGNFEEFEIGGENGQVH